MVPFSVHLKVLVPGYRGKWRCRSSIMLDHFAGLAPQLSFGRNRNTPWIRVKGVDYRLHGFWSGQKELIEWYVLGAAFPREIPKEYYRLVKDYITRYLYPHMRPDLTPKGVRPANWSGFHGQHKESLDDYEGGDRKELLRVFTPKPDDVIINGGSFVGFGDLHMSPKVPQGRIFSIEADAASFALLRTNLEHNDVRNATAIQRALWNEDTVLELETGPAQANTLISKVRKGETTQRVRTITIDGLVEEQGLAKVDMISLTLNGAEVETLEGAAKTLQEFRPRVRLPGWYTRGGVPIWKLAQNSLEQKGYRVFISPRGNVLAIH